MNNKQFLCKNATQIAEKGSTYLFKNKTEKNALSFEKYSDFVDLWNEFLIVYTVLRVSRRNKLRNASPTSICFACCRIALIEVL